MRSFLPRTTGIALATGLAFALSACSTTVDPTSTDTASTTAEGETSTVDKILFDYPFTALPIYAAVSGYAQERADELGIELEFTNDNMDLALQVTNLTTYLSSDIDAAVSFPADPASIEGLAQQYMDANKIWVSYGGDLESQDATIQFSFEESGRILGEAAGQWALDTLGDSAKVLILEDLSIQIGQERTQGLIDGLTSVAPNIDIVAQQQAITPDDGMTVTNAVLAQHPDVNIVIAAVGDAAAGAYQALITSGRDAADPNTYVGGLDGNLQAFQAMKNGEFFRGIAMTPPQDLGYAVIDVPLGIADGTGSSVDLPAILVTEDDPNIDDYIADFGG